MIVYEPPPPQPKPKPKPERSLKEVTRDYERLLEPIEPHTIDVRV